MNIGRYIVKIKNLMTIYTIKLLLFIIPVIISITGYKIRSIL